MEWVYAQGSTSPESAFLQYGAIGLVALISIYAVIKLFDRLSKAHERELTNKDREIERVSTSYLRELEAKDKEIERIKVRADRYEVQLAEQNKVIQDRIVVALMQTAEILKAVMDEEPRR